MVSNKELLFNLIKKLEKEEIKFEVGERKDHFNIFLDDNEGNAIKFVIKKKIESFQTIELNTPYETSWNKELKEKFYKEKGLDKCWVKDCSNKIYQTENDYKKVRVPCQDKHMRMVCKSCAIKIKE